MCVEVVVMVDEVELFDFGMVLFVCVYLVCFDVMYYWFVLIVYYIVLDGWLLGVMLFEFVVFYCVYVLGELVLFVLLLI